MWKQCTKNIMACTRINDKNNSNFMKMVITKWYIMSILYFSLSKNENNSNRAAAWSVFPDSSKGGLGGWEGMQVPRSAKLQYPTTNEQQK
jgi:hypothetical protein